MYFLNELLKTDCAFLLNVEILASQVFYVYLDLQGAKTEKYWHWNNQKKQDIFISIKFFQVLDQARARGSMNFVNIEI